MTILKGLMIVVPDAEKGVWAEELVAATGEVKEELEVADSYLCLLQPPLASILLSCRLLQNTAKEN